MFYANVLAELRADARCRLFDVSPICLGVSNSLGFVEFLLLTQLSPLSVIISPRLSGDCNDALAHFSNKKCLLSKFSASVVCSLCSLQCQRGDKGKSGLMQYFISFFFFF